MFEKNEAAQRWLEELIASQGGAAGTVHAQRGGDLYLVAAHNIPPKVIEAIARVPHGKGMAGAAQVRKAPVQTCNLQTDQTGTVKPGARAVDAQAAVALPVLGSDGEVRAIVGVAWMKEGEIAPEQERAMMELASGLPLA